MLKLNWTYILALLCLRATLQLRQRRRVEGADSIHDLRRPGDTKRGIEAVVHRALIFSGLRSWGRSLY